MTEATKARELVVGATYKARNGDKVLVSSGPLHGAGKDHPGSYPFVGQLADGTWKRFKRDGAAIGSEARDRDFDIVDFTEVETRRGPGMPAPIALRVGWCFEDREGRRYVIGPKQGDLFPALNGTSRWFTSGRVNDNPAWDTRWDLITEIGECVKGPGGSLSTKVIYEGLWVTRAGEKVRVRDVPTGTIILQGVRPDFVATIHKEAVYYDARGKAIYPNNTNFDLMHHFNTSWIPGNEDPGDKKPLIEAPKPEAKKEEDEVTVPHEDLIQAVLRKEPVQMKRADGTWEDLRSRSFAITMLMTQTDKEFRLKPIELVVWGYVERLSDTKAVFTSGVSEFDARTACNVKDTARQLVRMTLDKDLKLVEFKHMQP